jgi:transcriptional regulator with XRE-family HTH domain
MFSFDRKRFGQAVKAYRGTKKYKQLAYETGIAPATLARFEHGIHVNNEHAFIRLCRLMRVNPADFPQAPVILPNQPLSLSRAQWLALDRLYRYRNLTYIRQAVIGTPETVTHLVQRGLAISLSMKFRRLPFIRISEAGIAFFERHSPEYRERYATDYEILALSS